MLLSATIQGIHDVLTSLNTDSFSFHSDYPETRVSSSSQSISPVLSFSPVHYIIPTFIHSYSISYLASLKTCM